MVAVKITDLTKKFDKLTAVDNVNLDIESGELFGLLGPNGAGKTTLISMLCTILKPTSGTAQVWNHDIIREQDMVRKSIGIVFQDQSLDDNLTGRENLQFHGRLYKVPKNVMNERMKELMELMELADRADDLVKTYSGGMRRRLEIARGLLHHPKVLFLDEPTLGLDPQTRRHIWEYIEKLNQNEGITMLLTTHYMDEADYLCDRIAIIDYGKIVALGNPSSLKESLGGDVISLASSSKDEKLREGLLKIENVTAVDFVEDAIRLTASKGETVIPEALNVVREHGVEVKSVSLHAPTLEDVFIKFTGRRLRDEAEGKKGQLKRRIGHRRRLHH
ncbi:MAG: ATP-binding cassette domain-containing protein [Methanomassiliicoccales archaeon]|nr:MAG: ATP-binding cassette domain-containing protein [Methanomassiliicoccales archaeon]